jgi:hypothetical protein
VTRSAHVLALERALQDCWSRELLPVYADALQADGDPRGALIALDLHVEAHGASAELAARHTELLEVWLGRDPAWTERITQFGFVKLTIYDASDAELAVLEEPGGSYVRAIAIRGRNVARTIAAIAAAPRPWLEHLIFDCRDPGPRIDAAALIAATPRDAWNALWVLLLAGGKYGVEPSLLLEALEPVAADACGMIREHSRDAVVNVQLC